MVRWLEANGYDVKYQSRRRHRPPQRRSGRFAETAKRSSRSDTTNTGRADSGRASKARATPASTSPSSAATRCSGRRGTSRASTARTPPTGRWSATRKRLASAKIDPAVDGSGIRSGPARGATRASARRPTAAGRKTASPARSGPSTPATTAITVPAVDGEAALLAEHARRGSHAAASRRWPPERSAMSGTKISTTARVRPASCTCRRRRRGVEKIVRLRRDGRHRHRDPQPDAVPRTAAARSSSAPARCSGRGASTATTTAAHRHADQADAAGDREPARRHGHAAGVAAARR